VDRVTRTQIILIQALDPEGRLYFDRVTGRQLAGVASPLTFKARIDPVDLDLVEATYPKDGALAGVGT
jgi:hypothetical protein